MIGLGEAISGRRKIYLDARFWIYLRDAAIGCPQRPVHNALLQQLRRAVALRAAVCPISDVLFAELLKQSDETTRLATARVIDELSSGVALCLEDQRVGTEFAHFLYDLGARAEVHPLDHLVWAKVCFVWGETYPRRTAFDAATERAMQKAFIDYQWSMPLERIVQVLGVDGTIPAADFAGTAQRLNEANRAHAADLRKFPDVVLNELAGVLDLYKERLADILGAMYESQKGQPATVPAAERGNVESHMRTAFINLFRLRPLLMAKRAPTLYVHAKCHAAVRWDRKRNLTANDLMDFHHAAAALGYCNAFFTDNPLTVLLTQNHVGLPRDLGRFVTADEADALEFVRGLV
jgi:hypothetical protein